MQDIEKTLEIYIEELYPTMWELDINQLVQPTRPHTTTTSSACPTHTTTSTSLGVRRQRHRQKDEIRGLIRQQCVGCRREQDRRAQMMKQTRELGRLPA